MNFNVAIVIPYYHSNLTKTEAVSYAQCLKILSRYPIILVLPDNISEEKCFGENVIYERVSASWLESIDTYNQMMLNPEFYQRFKMYEYILIYQLDAFVFNDSLEKFCAYGYDYIGAPWLGGVKYYKDFSQCVWHVGNGGFSLRKVNSFINILENIKFEYIDFQEDVFWASRNGKEFHVAPIDIALQFGFECDVEKCYLLNRNKIPFGCHAWEKYNFSFWKPYVIAEGYNLDIKCMTTFESKNDYRHLEVEAACILNSCKQYLHCLNKKIYIWGAGSWGKECGWLLKKCGLDRFCYIDSCVERQRETLWNAKIEAPEILEGQDKEGVSVIVAIKGKEDEILNIMKSMGYKYQQDVFLYKDWIENILLMNS